MYFKRFLDINDKENNKFILFKNNKIFYETEIKTFLLDSNYLDIDIDNSKFLSLKKRQNLSQLYVSYFVACLFIRPLWLF